MSKGLWDLAFMHLIFPVNKMYFFHHFYPFTVPWCLPISPDFPYDSKHHLPCNSFLSHLCSV